MKQITCPHCGDTYPDFDVAHVCSQGPYAPKLKPKMNERIRELMEEAGIYDFVVESMGINEEMEKFAELIVRECAELAKHHVMNISTYGDAEFVDEQIKEHFGVKE